MKWLFKLAMLFLGQHMQNRAIDHAKRQGIMAYLQVLQSSRRLIVLALIGFVILQTMILAAFGAMVTLVLLWDHEFQGKLELLFGLFIGMTALPLLGLIVLGSERVWYKVSGAEKMVDDLSRRNAA